MPTFNSLLIYRILKLLYGKLDILAAFQNSSAPNAKIIPAAIDWGYTIQVTDHLFAEIVSIHSNTRLKLRFWISKNTEEIKQHLEKGKTFQLEFMNYVEKNIHLFSEAQDVPDEDMSLSAFSNIFAERYKSAEQIFMVARHIDNLPSKKDMKWDEPLLVNTGGSLYLSSAILYVMAIEALINTIYHLLLKPDFRAKSYERITIRGDLDLRIVTAHVLCEGFGKQILTPHTELWSRLLKLRDFRNNIVHANITPDHNAYALREDLITFFFYCGVTDFRGRKEEAKAKRHYPTTMAQVNERVVTEIKETVDQIVQAITEAASEERKTWFNSWLWEAMITRFKSKTAN